MSKGMSRREMMLGGLALTGAAWCSIRCGGSESGRDDSHAGNAQRLVVDPQTLASLLVPGVHAYAEKWVVPGTTLGFRVSSQSNYKLSVVRLGWDIDSPALDWNFAELPPRQALRQSIRPGSYVHIANSLPATSRYSVLSLECWVRPWRQHYQGLISQYSYDGQCGFGLFLDELGRPQAYFGDGRAFRLGWLLSSTEPLPLQQWSHIVATFSRGTGKLWVNGFLKVSNQTLPSSTTPGEAPLRLAAYGTNGQTTNCLDGDLGSTVVYARALDEATIKARYSRGKQFPVELPANYGVGSNVLGCWLLNDRKNARVADSSAHGRTGQIVNRATWMVGGPSFALSSLDRFNPAATAEAGGFLRFASDDLYDCGWEITDSYTMPNDLPTGVYAGRIECDSTPTPERYDVTFVTRWPASKPKAPILVLCATNTWLAYSVAFPRDPDSPTFSGVEPGPLSVPDLPAFGFYGVHHSQAQGAQPAYQMGINMPWSAFPYTQYIEDYSHLVRAERHLHVWLEKNGYDYDLASDRDLQHEPTLLDGYEVVCINGHSEYWSSEGYAQLERFLNRGGKAVVLSGNTMFWRVAFSKEFDTDDEYDLIECRKLPKGAGGILGGHSDDLHEVYHSDGRRGGLMRESGTPASGLIGLDCIGYGVIPSTYKVNNSGHPFFNEPEPLNLPNGSAIGLNQAQHEYDVRLEDIPGAPMTGYAAPTLLASAPAIANPAHTYFNYRTEPVEVPISSEIVDWERPLGGRIFNFGSIAAGRGVATDPALGKLMRNVLHHFGVSHHVALLATDRNGELWHRQWRGGESHPIGSNWQNLNGDMIGTPECVRLSPGKVGLMGVTSAGRLQYKWWDGTDWLPNGRWQDLGGELVGAVGAIGWNRDLLNIFARGVDGQIYNKWWSPSGWGPTLTDWQSLGGEMSSAPTAISWRGNILTIAAIGIDGRLKYRWWDGTDWCPNIEWMDLGGENLQGRPTMISWGGTRNELFVVDASGNVFTKWSNGPSWNPSPTGWSFLGNGIRPGTQVVAVATNGLFLTIFAIGVDGRVKSKWLDGSQWWRASANWAPADEWYDLGGNLADSLTATVWRGGYVSIAGLTPAGTIAYKYWDGSTWSDWLDMTSTLSGQAGQHVTVASWVG